MVILRQCFPAPCSLKEPHSFAPSLDSPTENLLSSNIPTHFERGLRVTDAQTLEVVCMVLRGQINEHLVLMVEQMGGRAVGLSGTDGNMVQAHILDERLGLMGEIDTIDPTVVQGLIDEGYMFAPQWKAWWLCAGKQRERAGQLCPSEVMRILIHFHQSHSRTFKAYYTEHVQAHLTSEFAHLVSYQRFVALMPSMLIPLLTYLQSRYAACRGMSSGQLHLILRIGSTSHVIASSFSKHYFVDAL